jgi:hypothetical protein
MDSEIIDEKIYFNLENNDLKISYVNLQKMAFIYNALENGWEIKKKNNKYSFSKKHEGKKEYIHENYLKRFIEQNLDITKLDLFVENN